MTRKQEPLALVTLPQDHHPASYSYNWLSNQFANLFIPISLDLLIITAYHDALQDISHQIRTPIKLREPMNKTIRKQVKLLIPSLLQFNLQDGLKKTAINPQIRSLNQAVLPKTP